MKPTREQLSASNANNQTVFDCVTKCAISCVAVAAVAVGLVLSVDAAAQETDGELKRYILIGMCEPADDRPETQEGFREFFVDQHVEDVSKTPNFVRSRVYELRGKHLEGATFTDFISFYEVDATSWEEAERVLNEWQRDPDAWEGRAHHMETGRRVGKVLSCPGSGWYEMIHTYDGPAKAASKLE
ncbi:MAG: hypothetical protein HOC70_01670 [Gammaproteobacteria bacterium]|jgi:hypothetical protein|nr:hypothetical protein [Gammaproteobacteria bacterium]MBT7369992.1 hypothetical protein [Gammaproteobacteria bacterium]